MYALGDVSEPEDSEAESSGGEKRVDSDVGSHNAPSTEFSLKLDDVSSSDDQEESEDDDDHGSDDEAPEDEKQRHQSNVFAGVEGRGQKGTARLGDDGSRDRKRDAGWRSQGDLKRAREILR